MNRIPQGADPPPTEAELDRLAALDRYGIVDTPPERGYEDLVQLAAQLCAAPIALVSFVLADCQWFKARLGFEPGRTPLAQSVCAHALALGADDLLVIPDLSQDPRTRENPLVTGPKGVRFYAGAPLRTPEGIVLGTLCVLDVVPRPKGLHPDQRRALSALARQVMILLELRRAVASREAGLVRQFPENEETRSDAELLVESEFRLRLAVEATGVGIFDFDVDRGRLVWDLRTRNLFGIGSEEPVSYEGTFLPGVHPDDRDRADRAVRAALDPEGTRVFACEYRTINQAGDVLKWIDARGQLTVEDGQARRLVGTVRDVTAERSAEAALRASEERYRLVTRATNDAIWDWDLVRDHVLWNEGLAAAYGWLPEQVVPNGGWWLARIHPDDRARVEADIRGVIDGSEPDWHHEYRFQRADGRYADVLDRGYMVRSADGAPLRMIGAMLDLTERNRAEAQLGAVFEGANVGIIQLDPRSLTVLRVNAKLCSIWGASEAEIVGQSIARWTPDEDAEARDRLHRRLAAGEIMRETLEKRFQKADGRLIWTRVNIVSQSHGDELLTTAMIEDITAEKAEAARHKALIALGDRMRDARSVADVSAASAELLGRTLGVARAGLAVVDRGGGLLRIDLDWAEGGLASLAGGHPLARFAATVGHLEGGEMLASSDASSDPRLFDDHASYAALGARAVITVPLMQRGELIGLLYAQEGVARTWTESEIGFASDMADRVWVTLGRLRAEEQQRILNRELSHRLKNTLSMVQAITAQTLRNVVDVEAAKEVLIARLLALGKAHDILLEGETESAEMKDLIRAALAIHDDGQPDRLSLDGPTILVGPQAALSLALMVHELATNAAKYGAFSQPAGTVSITWSIDGGATPNVTWTWTERGGPRVTPPVRAGFGSRLIERGLANAVAGETEIDYAPEGLVCRVIAPLGEFTACD